MSAQAPPIDPAKLEPIIERRCDSRWPLIPLLQDVQAEFGYIPPILIKRIADACGVFPSQVQGVISFYSQFYTEPRGRNIVRVCRGTACHVKGGRSILRAAKDYLGIEEDETTEDFNFTLETVACLGACFLAPTMLVNKDYYGNLAPQRVPAILKLYQRNGKDEGY